MNDRLANDVGTENMFPECALEIAQSIDSLEGRSDLISLVAFRYAEAGEIDLAVNAAATINDSYLNRISLSCLARSQFPSNSS